MSNLEEMNTELIKDEDEINFEYTSEVVCPWCGYEYHDSWEFSNEGNEICPECFGEFEYWRDITVDYSTKRS